MAKRLMKEVLLYLFLFALMKSWVGASAAKRSIDGPPSCKELLASPPSSSSQLKKGRQAVCYACNFTTFPTLCATALLSSPSSRSATPTKLAPIALNLALVSLNKAYALATSLTKKGRNDNATGAGALEDCAELMSDSKDHLSDSISRLKSINHPLNSVSIHDHIQDALVWTSAALTSQSTCSDGLSDITTQEDAGEESPSASPKGKSPSSSNSMKPTLDYVGQMITNALDLIAHLETHLCSWKTPDPYKFPNCKK